MEHAPETMSLTLSLVIALASGCVVDASGPTAEIATETLTADDLAGGARPLIDVTAPVSWIIDGTDAPVDFEQIDVSTPIESTTLGAWLVRDWGLDRHELEELARGRLEIGAGGAPSAAEPIGGQSAVYGCTGKLICQCHWSGWSEVAAGRTCDCFHVYC